MEGRPVSTSGGLAVALLSGGPDALVAAAVARREGCDVAALFVDYGQRTSARERIASAACAAWLGAVETLEVSVDVYTKVSTAAMLHTGAGVDNAQPMSEYVPFRNTMLAAHAVAWAETLGAQAVILGSTASDRTSPDNSPGYVTALQQVVDWGTANSGIRVWAPMLEFTKAQMVARGRELGVPFELSWSCQNAESVPCVRCNNCVARAGAFEACGWVDPLVVA